MEGTTDDSTLHGLSDESLMDPAVILQAINGVGTSKDKGIKRQRRGNRMKIYDNGFIFTYDKDSQCGQKSFWRCERKSECQARVHTYTVTNQIVKRINEHTHEAPKLDELPPWLVLKQTQSDASDEAITERIERTTGVLINANFSGNSANNALAKILEREIDEETGETSAALDIFHSVKEELEQEESFIAASPPSKKRKRIAKKDESDHDDWEDVIEAAKKLIDYARSKQSISETASSPCSCPPSLLDFLQRNNLSEYAPRLAKFSLEKIRLLTQKDCFTLLQNEPDGLLLFHSLKNVLSPEVSSSSSSQLTLFVASSDGDEEPVYQMIVLQEKTPSELRKEMVQKGQLAKEDSVKICVEGPHKIKVELNEKIVSSWPSETVLQFSISKGVCLLNRISS